MHPIACWSMRSIYLIPIVRKPPGRGKRRIVVVSLRETGSVRSPQVTAPSFLKPRRAAADRDCRSKSGKRCLRVARSLFGKGKPIPYLAERDNYNASAQRTKKEPSFSTALLIFLIPRPRVLRIVISRLQDAMGEFPFSQARTRHVTPYFRTSLWGTRPPANTSDLIPTITTLSK